jgi:40S ribosome biogenesis protein Tsr1 and BMS1 C-terminal
MRKAQLFLIMYSIPFSWFRPLFSSDNINSDKHKLERFLHPGRFSVATVYAPICFPPLPLIVLKKRDGEPPAVAATGSLKSVDPDRIILKKIILTGYCYSCSQMFLNYNSVLLNQSTSLCICSFCCKFMLCYLLSML